jgi:hypothetical protein
MPCSYNTKGGTELRGLYSTSEARAHEALVWKCVELLRIILKVYLPARRTMQLSQKVRTRAQTKILCRPQCSANSDMSWIQQRADLQASSKKKEEAALSILDHPVPVLYKCRKRLTERTSVPEHIFWE